MKAKINGPLSKWPNFYAQKTTDNREKNKKKIQHKCENHRSENEESSLFLCECACNATTAWLPILNRSKIFKPDKRFQPGVLLSIHSGRRYA